MPAAIARPRALVAAYAALLPAWVAFPAAAADVGAEPMSFERAASSVRAERDIEQAVAALDRHARQGHGRARVLLGTMLLEGTLVPRNAPLGLAFVRLGAETSDEVFNQSVQQKIANLLLHHQSAMSGAELIASDRLVGDIVDDTNRYLLEEYGDTLALALPARPVAIVPTIQFGAGTVQLTLPTAGDTNPSVRRGCATATGSTCPPSTRSEGRATCTGEIGPADLGASGRGTKHFVMPNYPDSARSAGIEGTLSVLAHVDTSGLVCSAAIVGPRETRKALADATLDAVVRWQLDPARHMGQPVESVRLLRFEFVLVP